MKTTFSISLIFTVLLAFSQAARSQQIGVSTPLNSNSHSFFESFRTNFGFSLPSGSGAGSRVVGLSPTGQLIPNVAFSQNGFNSAIPALGGFDPNAGLRFGFGRVGRGGGGFSLGFTLAQGSTRTSVSNAPSITVLNGGFGSISNGALRPFVTGVTPVVGTDNAVTRGIASGRLQPYSPSRSKRPYDPNLSTIDNRISSATTGAPSLAEIRKRQSAESSNQDRALAEHIRAAKLAEAAGEYAVARVQILKASRKTDDPERKQQLKYWLRDLKQR